MLSFPPFKMQPEMVWPADLFRRLVGGVSFFYFLSLLYELPLFSISSGLIPHREVLRIFPFVSQFLFTDQMPFWLIKSFFLAGMLLSLLLFSGRKQRLISIALYVLAVCVFRWNFLVTNIEDVFVTLFLFWLILLPAGNTTFFIGRNPDRNSISEKQCPFTVILFLTNISLIYLVAGISKWFSPMWLEGTAVFAALNLPFSNITFSETPGFLFLFKLLNWVVLIFEPLLCLLPWLPAGHWFKKVLGVIAVCLHGFNIIVLGLVFSNTLCLLALILIFRKELTTISVPDRPFSYQPSPIHKIIPGNKIRNLAGMLVVLLLTGATGLPVIQDSGWRKPAFEKPQQAGFLPHAEIGSGIQRHCQNGLWFLGLGQSYRLVDWIDNRNFKVELLAERIENGETTEIKNLQQCMPATIRMSLLYSYLVGVTWHDVPPTDREPLKNALATRLALYLNQHEPRLKQSGFRLYYSLYRINPEEKELYIPVTEKRFLTEFRQPTQ